MTDIKIDNLNILRALYNVNNRLISEEDIIRILNKIGITQCISGLDMKLWQQVFVHKSYTSNCNRNYAFTHIQQELAKRQTNEESSTEIRIPPEIEKLTEEEMIPLFPDSNERLEWLGDSIIQSVSAQYLFSRFPMESEGFLTKLRSKMVRTDSLSKCARYLGLDKYIIMSRDVEHLYNGRSHIKILEDAFESFTAALFLSADLFGLYNYDLCKKFLYIIFESTMDIVDMIYNNTNYKDRLMQYYQKNFKGTFPLYFVEKETVRGDGVKEYTISVTDPYGKKIEYYTATSKKIAEKMAAKRALAKFNILDAHESLEENDCDDD